MSVGVWLYFHRMSSARVKVLANDPPKKKDGKAARLEVFVPVTEPRVWKVVCDRLGVAPNHKFEYLGSGSFGSAYLMDSQTVVKFSGDQTEADASAKIMGEKYETLVQVRDVFRFTVREGYLSVIVQERLDKGDEAWKGWGELATFYYYTILKETPFNTGAIPQFKEWCANRFGAARKPEESTAADNERTQVARPGTGKPIDKTALFQEHEPMQPIPDEWVRTNVTEPSEEFYRWFKQLCEDLASAEIEFFDLNGGNMMKRSGKHVVTDLGISKTMRPKKIDVISKFLKGLSVQIASAERLVTL